MTPRIIDRSGVRSGRLVAIELAPRGCGERVKWRCRCDCGNVVDVLATNLQKGNTTSCGCSRKEHGMARSAVHQIWRSMRQRCENPNDRAFKNYGARGIRVSEEWQDFANFYRDMGDPPERGTLERIDNNGPYSKDNCQWAPYSTQARNKRSNQIVTAFGRSQTVTDWAIEYGIHPRTLHNRIFRAKMPPEEALNAGKVSLRGWNLKQVG